MANHPFNGGCYWKERQKKGKHLFCCALHFSGQAMFSFRAEYFFHHEGKIRENRSTKTQSQGCETVIITVTCLTFFFLLNIPMLSRKECRRMTSLLPAKTACFQISNCREQN